MTIGYGDLKRGMSIELDGEPFSVVEYERSKMQRSEEHTSELQSLVNLVCRLLLEKKNTKQKKKKKKYFT